MLTVIGRTYNPFRMGARKLKLVSEKLKVNSEEYIYNLPFMYTDSITCRTTFARLLKFTFRSLLSHVCEKSLSTIASSSAGELRSGKPSEKAKVESH